MLQHLVESDPSLRRWRHVTPAAGVSTILHAAVFLGWFAIFGSAEARPRAEPDRAAQFVGLAAPIERPAPPQNVRLRPMPHGDAGGGAPRVAPKFVPRTGGDAVAGDRPAGFQALAAPVATSGIPTPDSAAQQAVRAQDFQGRGVVGGVAGGKPPDGPVAATASELAKSVSSGGGSGSAAAGKETGGGGTGGDWYDASELEDPPRLLNGGEVAKALARLHPPILRDAGVGGIVDLDFVVGKDGRVLVETIRIVSSTNELFSLAAQRALLLCRFSPGRTQYRGQSVVVQVRVRMPLEWSVKQHD